MGIALAFPEPTNKGGRGKKSETTVLNTDVSSAYLKHARFVLRNCRDKAIEVLRNSKYPLTVAYEEAQAIVEKQRIAEEERQRQLAALAILREEFSDLAALVDDQRLGLPEAIAAGATCVCIILDESPSPDARWPIRFWRIQTERFGR